MSVPDSANKFKVEVSHAKSLNAMAVPGGLIVVTSALSD
jgi:predicted Zn-dependent protease